jgi:catechol 2,3-dioxygenase-like lactoylglutathione lyase family enzyme
MSARERYPHLLHVVLDTPDPRALAEFYRELLGLMYKPGHQDTDPDGDDWLVLRDSDGRNALAFQRVELLAASTWPDTTIPQQLHLDLTVDSVDELNAQDERARALGATMILDRADDPEEPLRVYADPAGHPFCIFVARNPVPGRLPQG